MEEKIKVVFVAVGNAPPLKTQEFNVSSLRDMGFVVTALRKLLNREGRECPEPLFVYVNRSFMPSPDALIGDLHKSCGTVDGDVKSLIINYCNVMQWG